MVHRFPAVRPNLAIAVLKFALSSEEETQVLVTVPPTSVTGDKEYISVALPIPDVVLPTSGVVPVALG
jgi:hypothetical protein